MSPSQFTTPEYNFDAGKPGKSGSSGCLTAFAIFAIVGLLACVGSGIFGYYYLKSRVSMDPQVVRQKTEEMLTIQIRDEFEPNLYMNLWVVEMSFFKTEDSKNTLMLVSMTADDLDNADLRTKIESQIQSSENERPVIKTVEAGERTLTIRGEPVEFEFNKAQDVKTKEPYYSISGTVDSNEADRKILIMLQVRQSEFPENEIVQMLESIE